jgi:thymidylate synthase (FAD)
MKLTPEDRAAIDAQRAQTHATRRPTVEALEERLFEPIPCLDHGFVRLVDYMGDDGAVVQAARVSYGKGTRTVHGDRGLIRYLMRHRHTTPFEMCELKLHVKLPIFIARQWIRHRSACLAGDSVLSFDLPNGEARGRPAHRGLTIAKFHDLWHHGAPSPTKKRKPTHVDRIEPDRMYTVSELARVVERSDVEMRRTIAAGRLPASRPEGRLIVRGRDWIAYANTRFPATVPMHGRLGRMKLRMCDEETGEIRHTRVVDIWQTGVKPVFRVTLEDGRSLKMTKDHRCLTDRGWQTLERATALRVREDGGVTWDSSAPLFATNGVPLHRSAEWLEARKGEGWSLDKMAAATGVSRHTIRKSLSQLGLQFTPAERSRLSGARQRGQKRQGSGRTITAAHRESIRRARSGPRSSFWKGGVSTERENIGGWTTEHATLVHQRCGWACVLCGSKEALEAHHVDPVWHNAARARDLGNLVTLCGACHTELHRRNLELDLAAWIADVRPPAGFWGTHLADAPRPAGKKKPRVRKLARAWTRIARIELVGEEPTYDLAVEGPFHNFVANGFIVHNSVNEYSARYSILDREFYLPSPEDLAFQSSTNRQGRGDTIPPDKASTVLTLLRRDAETSYDTYERLLGDEFDLARELARMDLTLNYYTQWYWKIDLHNLLHFLSLRMDAHAQYEIRVYGEAIGSLVKAWVPHTWEAFEDYRLGGAQLSKQMLDVVRRRVSGETVTAEMSGMSKREWEELEAILRGAPLEPGE